MYLCHMYPAARSDSTTQEVAKAAERFAEMSRSQTSQKCFRGGCHSLYIVIHMELFWNIFISYG